MIYKSFVAPVILFSMMFLGIFGCGDDEEKPDKPTVDTSVSVPMYSKEDLLGSWKIISINDDSPLAFIYSQALDDEIRAKIDINRFTYDFAADDSWSLNLEFEVVDFVSEFAIDENMEFLRGNIDIIGTWSGTYVINESTITIITKDSDVKITSDPQDFIEEGLNINEMELRKEILDDLSESLFTPFRESFITIEGEKLTLSTPGSKKTMVLEKQ